MSGNEKEFGHVIKAQFESNFSMSRRCENKLSFSQIFFRHNQINFTYIHEFNPEGKLFKEIHTYFSMFHIAMQI